MCTKSKRRKLYQQRQRAAYNDVNGKAMEEMEYAHNFIPTNYENYYTHDITPYFIDGTQ